MSERKPMDDFFRDRLYHHSAETPLHLWEAMDTRLNAAAKARRRRRVYLGLAALFLVFSGTALLYWSPSAQPATEPSSTQPSAPVAPPGAIADTKSATAAPTLAATEPHSSASTPATISATSNAAASRPTSSRPQPVASTPPVTPAPLNNDERSITNSSSTLESKKETSQLASEPNVGLNRPLEQQTEPNPTPLAALNVLPNLQPTLLAYEPALGLDDTRPLYTGRGKGWRVYGELLMASEHPTRQLEAREPEFEAYRLAREQTEQVQSGQSATLRFSMISVDGFAIRSGLRYAQHQEQLNLPQYRQQNQFSTVDIPVVFGYERNNLGKFTLSANVSAQLNMAFSQRGTFLSPDLTQRFDFSSNTPDAYPAFRNRLGLTWYGSIAASYPISPRLRLVLEPYVLRTSGSFTHADYAIDQRYQYWGIQLGLRKKINKYIYFARP